MMVARGNDSMQTAFTVTVDYRHGTTTGISAADRATTIRALVDPQARAGDFNRPGHLFPLRAVPGGVLRRPGTPKPRWTCAVWQGCAKAACSRKSSTMTAAWRVCRNCGFARLHGLPIVSIRDLIAYRTHSETTARVDREAVAA